MLARKYFNVMARVLSYVLWFRCDVVCSKIPLLYLSAASCQATVVVHFEHIDSSHAMLTAACSLLYVQPSLAFRSSTFCPHSAY